MKPPSQPPKTRDASASRRRAQDSGAVTLEMVAQRAGVSPSTVSRILNGTAIVSAAKQSAVDAAIRQLGFGPNPVARGLYRRQMRAPDDVSLVGFDDVAPAKFSLPPLTTVRQSIYDMGSQAAVAVMALLGGAAPELTLPRPQLVPRESTRRLLR